jgi:hypothetical protein
VGPATAGGTVNVQAVTMTNCAATGDGTTYTITLYAGLSYALVTNSLVMPADGSQTIRTFVDNETGIRVTDGGGNGMDVPLWHIPFAGGIVIASNIVNYPADAALQTWVKAQLNSVGLQFGFSDNY